MFCGDGATTDHGIRNLAHGISGQNAVDLSYCPCPIVACTDKQGVGEVEAIGLGRIERAIKEVFDGARHIAKIFWRPKQHPVTGEQIVQSSLECPHEPGACLWDLTGPRVYG